MASPTRQGRVPKGWSKQGIVVPDPIWDALRQLGDKHGYGSLKSLCTLGMGIVAGMPEHIRTGMLKWLAQAMIDGPQSITPEAVWAECVRLMRSDIGNATLLGAVTPVTPVGGGPPEPKDKKVSPSSGGADDAMTHEMTRILDPAFLAAAKKKRGVG